MRGVDPGTANQRDMGRVEAELGERGAIFRVLHDNRPAAGNKAQGPAERSLAPRRPRARAEPHHRRHHRRRGARRERQPCGDPAEQRRLQRDVIEDVGSLAAIEPHDFPQCAQPAEDAVAAPLPAERVKRKPLAANLLAMLAHPCRDRHGKPRIARRPRHRQAVRAEIPILGHEKEQLWRGSGFDHDSNASSRAQA